MFIIHLMPRYAMENEEHFKDVYFRYKYDTEIKHEQAERGAWEYNREIFYADSEKDAELIAQKLAQMHVGREVCILESAKSYTAVNPELVCKVQTKQGSFPI